MNICVMLKKNSYWKNSCNLLVFVLLNGVLIKKILLKNRVRLIVYIFVSKYFNIYLYFFGKKILDLFNMVLIYFMIEYEIL